MAEEQGHNNEKTGEGLEKKALPVEMPSDEELEGEIAEALGEASLMDWYNLEEPKALKQPKQAAAAISNVGDGVVAGKVVGMSGEDIFIDLGGKAQGVLSREEMGEDEKIEVGMILKVSKVGYDKKDNLVIVSRKTAQQQIMRRDLKVGALVEARVIGSNKGGLEMDVRGLKGFMPASQIALERIEEFDSLLGQRLICEVLEVERGDRNLVLSRRNVLVKERQDRQKQLWEELEKGQARRGVVRSLREYGAFVDLGGVEGLLHVSELSWARVKHPKEILQEGQEIEVLVIEADKEKRRISLSLKQAGGDPWSTVEQRYPVGSRHEGRIMNILDFGAFAELEAGVEGLIPVSEMSWAGQVRHPREVVQRGSVVEVEILQMDPPRRRISLSMKRVQENPWKVAARKYVAEEVYPGTVSRLAEFGAFVTLEEGIDGLIHISELAEGRVKKAGDVVKVGDKVSVRVLSVDTMNQRISLSLRGLAPVGQEQKSAETEDKKEAVSADKKKRRPRRGGLTWDEGGKWGDWGKLKS